MVCVLAHFAALGHVALAEGIARIDGLCSGRRRPVKQQWTAVGVEDRRRLTRVILGFQSSPTRLGEASFGGISYLGCLKAGDTLVLGREQEDGGDAHP